MAKHTMEVHEDTQQFFVWVRGNPELMEKIAAVNMEGAAKKFVEANDDIASGQEILVVECAEALVYTVGAKEWRLTFKGDGEKS